MMPSEYTKTAKVEMAKPIEYYQKELRGIRTGRASTALLEYLKVDAYGSSCDLRDIAAVSVPEPTQLLVKPFDPSLRSEISKAIESADLGLNPMSEGDAIRINVPPPSADRRSQLAVQVRKLAEEAKVAIRNERRDAIKHIDADLKDKSISEDDAKRAKSEIEDLTKDRVGEIDTLCDKKVAEVEQL
ncbi:MAG: ribosome recycling factor [Phycisphaerales bacterium]|nr:ribosome recycling factor [Phycisphaerales bacterium]